MNEPVEWDADNCPSSPRFGDVYRSRAGGWQQAHSVFLAGCGLPHAWRGCADFTLLETGFGLGLNFLATWLAWVDDPAASDRLHYVAIEAYPVAPEDIRRSVSSLAQDPGVPHDTLQRARQQADALAQAWRHWHSGIQRWTFVDARLTLTLAVGDVQDMLGQLDERADAIYLDGFSPACNPGMWSQATLDALARHAHAGTRLATYSTAPDVRQRLQQAGFMVRRCKGLPPKRRRLEACLGSFKAD